MTACEAVLLPSRDLGTQRLSMAETVIRPSIFQGSEAPVSSSVSSPAPSPNPQCLPRAASDLPFAADVP